MYFAAVRGDSIVFYICEMYAVRRERAECRMNPLRACVRVRDGDDERDL